jgi:hypothetical protein
VGSSVNLFSLCTKVHINFSAGTYQHCSSCTGGTGTGTGGTGTGTGGTTISANRNQKFTWVCKTNNKNHNTKLIFLFDTFIILYICG